MDYKTVCILGRQPALGMAELESVFGPENILPAGEAALLTVPAKEINFKRLGGVIKTARILSVLDTSDWPAAKKYLLKTLPEHLQSVEGKLTLGVSLYGFDLNVKRLNQDLLELKKAIKKTGKPVRVVPNKNLELNSAQVLHNKLTHKGGWELLFIKNGRQTILAQTLFIQDIEAYAARDQARPKRDARVGMLPPKLAQIMVNLATGPIEQQIASDAGSDGAQGADEKRSETYKKYDERASQSATQRSAESNSRVASSASKQAVESRLRLLDPFCGTGVVLQEALLMGCHVLGSDIDPRMVDYTRTNLQWLIENNPRIEGGVALDVADATHYTWPRFSAVVSEAFLGRPLAALPAPSKLNEIIQDANTITRKFLANLSPQLKAGQKVVLAVPAWRGAGGQLTKLPVLDKLTEMGYNYLDFKHVARNQLVYFREDQVVARQLLRLEKR